VNDVMLDFKRDIDLMALACERYGYTRDTKKSSQRFPVLRHESGDKISVSRAADGTWLYYSFRDPVDNGTIIDFVMRHDGARSPAEACRLIAQHHGQGTLPPPSKTPPLPSIRPFDRAAFIQHLKTTRPLTDSSYLVRERCLNDSLIRHCRFSSSIGQDAAGRTIFFHRDAEGVCGWEAKSAMWTGFATGGRKTLWSSSEFPNDKVLVLAESAIDALSYAQLHPLPRVRYMSFGGDFGRQQLEHLKAAVARLPPDGKVILAVDRDQGGDRFVTRLTVALADCKREVARHSPARHKDWNDVLKASVMRIGSQVMRARRL